MDTPLVSIIIPTYNRVDLVTRAIQSARTQTYPHTQIIVVDDGSTDDTAARLASLPGIEFFRQHNQGPSAARNAGLEHAHGDLIASLDSDDFWRPEFLAESIQCLLRTKVGFTFANWDIHGPTVPANYASQLHTLSYLQSYAPRTAQDWIQLSAEETRSLFVAHCPAPSASSVVRRSLIPKGWTSGARISDDRLLLLDAIIDHGSGAAFTFNRLWTKWLDGTNICDRHGDKIILAHHEIHDRHLLLHRFAGRLTTAEMRTIRCAVAKSYLDIGYHEWARGHRRQSMQAYINSLRMTPSQRATLGLLKATLAPRPRTSLPPD